MSLEIKIAINRNGFSVQDWLEIVILSIMFAIKLVPQLQYTFTGMAWSLGYHVFFALWFFLTLLSHPNWFLNTKELQTIVLWLIYLFCTFVFFSNTQWGYFSLLLSFWEPVIIFLYYTQYDCNSQKRSLIAWLGVIMLVYGLLGSIQTINANELAAREASSGHSSDDAVLTGNYSFTTSITVLLGVMLCYIQSYRFKAYKIKCLLATAIAVGTVVFVFKCNLMISILALIIAIVFYFIMNGKKKHDVRRTFIIVFCAIVFFLLYSNISELLADTVDSLGNLIGSETISDRTALISTWLRGGSMQGNLESRINLCRIALNTFFENPIFGIGPQNNAALYFKTQLGLHATFFDEWARFGIIGMLLLMMPFLKYYKFVVASLSEGIRVRAFRTGFWIFIIISMLNPVVSANVGIALFYIMPVLLVEES